MRRRTSILLLVFSLFSLLLRASLIRADDQRLGHKRRAAEFLARCQAMAPIPKGMEAYRQAQEALGLRGVRCFHES